MPPIVANNEGARLHVRRHVASQIRPHIGQHLLVRPVTYHESARAEERCNDRGQRCAGADLENPPPLAKLGVIVEVPSKHSRSGPQPMGKALSV